MSESIEKTDDLPELIKKARGGSFQAAKEVRRRYAERPEEFMALASARPPVESVRRLIIQGSSDTVDMLKIEGRLVLAQQIETALAGPNPSPIESLLASQCATNWLDLNSIDGMSTVIGNSSVHFRAKLAEHFDKTRTRSHDRFIKSLKALAFVRRINLANLLVQINTGPSQMNIGGPPKSDV